MKKTIVTLLLILYSTFAFAIPSEDDRQQALSLMYTLSSDQDLHFRETSNYETVSPRWTNGLVSQACAYSTFAGKGYVITVSKVEEGKVYNIERHFGDDESVEEKTNGVWTCMNCNGETYHITKEHNEHGLCTF